MKRQQTFRGIFIAMLLVGSSIGATAVMANNYKIYKGEENAPEAYIELDKSHVYRLVMVCKRNFRKKTLELTVDIIVDGNAKVPPEAKLRMVPFDTKKNMDLCINSRCKTYTWEDSGGEGCDGPSSCPLRTSFSIDQSGEKIRSVRVVVPNDNTNYEFQGDVDGILKRICK